MKIFYISIAGVKDGNEKNIDAISQTGKFADDLIKGLNYIFAHKYDIKMIDFKTLRVEIKDKNDG